jgi:hypothetical protein
MPKTKPAKLPEWANEPLKFSVHPDEALAKAAFKSKKSRSKRK